MKTPTVFKLYKGDSELGIETFGVNEELKDKYFLSLSPEFMFYMSDTHGVSLELMKKHLNKFFKEITKEQYAKIFGVTWLDEWSEEIECLKN